MDSTECFENHETRTLNEIGQPLQEEEVVIQFRLAFVQLGPGALEVKVDVQMFEEFGDRIAVRVRLLLDDFDEIFQRIATARRDDDRHGQVAENVRTHRLDGVQVQRLVQAHFDDAVRSFWMMHEHEYAPVDQPCALLQCLHRTGKIKPSKSDRFDVRLDQRHLRKVAVVDVLPQSAQVFQSRLPIQSENGTGQKTPQHVEVVLQ